MRYLAFIKHTEDLGEAPQALYDAVGKDVERGFAEGWLIDAGGLSPTNESTEIRLKGGEISVTQGPWAEAREIAGGYSIIEARSHEEAVEHSRRLIELHQQIWPGVEIAAEVRQILGGD